MGGDKKNHYISIAGIMGSGKTTAANLLARGLGFHLFEENVRENVFLPLFYKDQKRWALPTQLFYLREKANQLEKVKNLLTGASVVQDSPIYQDHFTYAKAQLLLGNMNNDEYALYQKFFDMFHQNLPTPDLIIQLDASLPVIQNRTQNRAREYEKEIDMSYVKILSDLQKEWIQNHQHLNILTVNSDNLNLAENREHQKEFVEMVKKKMAQ